MVDTEPQEDSQEDPLKKSKPVQFYVEPELHEEAKAYAKEHGVSLGALLRALLRFWVNPEDPRPLPPGIEDERKRPSRRKSDEEEDESS